MLKTSVVSSSPLNKSDILNRYGKHLIKVCGLKTDRICKLYPILICRPCSDSLDLELTAHAFLISQSIWLFFLTISNVCNFPDIEVFFTPTSMIS